MAPDRRGGHYERLVAAVRHVLGPGAELDHDVAMPGLKSGQDRQVDVAVRRTDGDEHRLLVVECKEHTRKIEIGRVDAFVGFLDDLGAFGGIMVTTAGYTSAALWRAHASRIETWVLRPAADADWAGYQRSLAVRITAHGTIYRDCELRLADGRVLRVRPTCILHDPRVQKDVFLDRVLNYALRDGFESGCRIEATLGDDLLAEVDGELVRVDAIVTTPRVEELHATDAIWQRPEDWVYFRQTPNGMRAENEFFEKRALDRIAARFARGGPRTQARRTTAATRP
jgi:hypothetical protein